ncbi:LysR substrate-binding domain-containing protein [Stappia indica]|uniref:LysR family transcriptional regulator n=1 Tax=Stappia indica TaxID=538381 RepID=A0A857CC72_9HYPH|nr:LysR substrate-binding domain-containing protein [Stappia indica]QGZ36489.1 LysR family transcriptional regulator [Stappia indica]
MSLRLPPLASLRLFEAAARHASFKQAAEELGLTPSAVSHGIDTLETWLGAPLFDRSGRAVSLTAAGEDLLPYVSEGLSMIATGAHRVSPLLGARRIRVSVAPTFARRWLVPRLGRFRGRHPEIDLHVDTSHRQAVFPLDGVDLAIRMGPAPWPSARSELLFRETLQPVAHPDLAARLPQREGRIDWARAPLIHVATVENDWAAWFAAAAAATGETLPPPGRGLHVDTVDLALEAAAQGLGVALARLPLCAGALSSPAPLSPAPAAPAPSSPASPVLSPLAGCPPVPVRTGYWALLPSGHEPRREIAAFLRWLKGESAAFMA